MLCSAISCVHGLDVIECGFPYLVFAGFECGDEFVMQDGVLV
jgi:hypothetical protein